MALGPIDPFQNIVGIDVEPPDYIYALVRVVCWLNELDFGSGLDDSDCNPPPPSDVIFHGWEGAILGLWPRPLNEGNDDPGSIVFQPDFNSHASRKLLVARSLLEKEQVDYASFFEQLDLTAETENEPTYSSFKRESTFRSTAEFIFPTYDPFTGEIIGCEPPSTRNYFGLAWDDVGAFPACAGIVGHSIESNGHEVTFDYEFYEPVLAKGYQISETRSDVGATRGRGVVERSGSWTVSLKNSDDIEIAYGGGVHRYEVVPEDGSEGDVVHKVLSANVEKLLDVDPSGENPEGNSALMERVIVVRYKYRETIAQ